MSRDLQRERLLAKLYSREAATAQARDYVDPDTGATVHLTPGEWELLTYDRAHPVERRAHDRTIDHEGHDRQRARDTDNIRNDAGDTPAIDRDDEGDSAPDDDNGDDRDDDDAPGTRARPLWRRRSFVVSAALVIVGGLIGAGVMLLVVRAQPALFGASDRAQVAATLDQIRSVFDSGSLTSSDPGQLAAIGFHRDSFRLVGNQIVYDRTGQIFAAQRSDGQYCLVLVKGASRAADACATAEGIAANGLTLRDATRESDGTLLTFTAQWNRNGEITWKLVETAH